MFFGETLRVQILLPQPLNYKNKIKKTMFKKKLFTMVLEKWYVYNISTTFLQQILSGKLLLVVIVDAKSNLNVNFEFEPITTNHLWFVIKML